MDSSLGPDARSRALLDRMTVMEKCQQLVGVLPHSLAGLSGLSEQQLARHLGNGIGHIANVGSAGSGDPVALAELNNEVQRYLIESTRLGIPAILHNEALNGVVAEGFTSFPTAIGLAATWNPDLVSSMADLIRRQMRASGMRQALSPVIDVARDARWGRVHETYGEEVLLVSAMGVAYIGALQGEDLREGVLATAKHFLGYSMTEGGLNLGSTQLGSRELYDVYATPFEAAIRLAGLRSVMNSYSDVDGEVVGASAAVLTDLLRGRLGFTGSVVSDYRTVQYLVERQRVAASPEEAGILALNAGLDVELPTAYGFGPTLATAVDEGRVEQEVLDRAVLRVLVHKFELGLFEQPYVDAEPTRLRALSAEGRDLSRTLAAQSITLLKNEGGLLPLDGGLRRVAVVGPHADVVRFSFANYTHPASLEIRKGIATGKSRLVGMEGAYGDMDPELMKAAVARMAEMGSMDIEQIVRNDYDCVSLVEAVRRLLPDAEVSAAPGTGVLESDPQDIDAAVALAGSADVVVLALGGRSGAFAGTTTEGEGTDSADIDLPAQQVALVRAVAALGKPMVAVLYMGRPYGIAAIDELVPAVLTAYYPGPEGAPAVADVLFGREAPSGKLPYSVPRHTGQVPVYSAQRLGSGYRRTDADMSKEGYRDLSATPLYPLGHGLTYADFDYGDLVIERPEIGVADEVTITVPVTNTGDRRSGEVVQLYVSARARGMARPAQQLAAFARVELDPGRTATVVFGVHASQLGFTAQDGRFVVEPGTVGVLVGSSSDDIRARGEFAIVGERTEVPAEGRHHLPTVRVE